ncbi:uncharacterized protein METZ01_LOCUS264279 [marine metagenome]|uniref:Uncharacterized protein n=1 Tax=marine metagenome TaxID=408172 RepID=A0A382JID7_9ZZZZ
MFIDIYKKSILKNSYLDVLKHINNKMVNAHYEKYKETIKKVARRNYRKRIVLLNEFLAEKSCKHCGESETICLKFYPHDSEIRKVTKRVGTSKESRKKIFELMGDSYILCSNCWIKLDNDLIEFI